MKTRPLTALLISDGKPGHFHQAEGVVAAIGKLRPVETVRIAPHRRMLVPTRTLHQLLNAGVPPDTLLWAAFGLKANTLPAADLVVSAGGETLAANAAVAQHLGVPNVFCGRLRRLQSRLVRLVIVSMDDPTAPPNHLVALPPSPFEVPAPAARQDTPRLGHASPPARVGVLIGGDSGAFRYTDADWQTLKGFLLEAHRAHGTRWLVTTSRRSDPTLADALAALARDPANGFDVFIDFRSGESGAVGRIFAQADAVLCTDDSTTMISEAVGARLPVVAVAPTSSAQEAREMEYRSFLAERGWYRCLPLAGLTPTAFLGALEEIEPRTTSQLDELAASLSERLPELFPAN